LQCEYAKHPRWTFHPVLTKRCLRRGVFKGIVDLQTVINRFVADYNQQPNWIQPKKRLVDSYSYLSDPHAE
jgi:hypothetical protein